jgi:hypothetical protein
MLGMCLVVDSLRLSLTVMRLRQLSKRPVLSVHSHHGELCAHDWLGAAV